MNTMEYKGYRAAITYSDKDQELFGKVVNTSHDRIFFGGASIKELRKNFKEAVEVHIKHCAEIDAASEKPLSKE